MAVVVAGAELGTGAVEWAEPGAAEGAEPGAVEWAELGAVAGVESVEGAVPDEEAESGEGAEPGLEPRDAGAVAGAELGSMAEQQMCSIRILLKLSQPSCATHAPASCCTIGQPTRANISGW